MDEREMPYASSWWQDSRVGSVEAVVHLNSRMQVHIPAAPCVFSSIIKDLYHILGILAILRLGGRDYIRQQPRLGVTSAKKSNIILSCLVSWNGETFTSLVLMLPIDDFGLRQISSYQAMILNFLSKINSSLWRT